MKHTAVEWFAEKVEQHLLTFGSIQPNVLSKFKQQAKEMEKDQHEETALSIVEILLDNLEGKNDLRGDEAFEHIWNKTYGGAK